MSAFQRVHDALSAAGSHIVIKGTGKLRATCPAHFDKRPSLSVDEKGSRVLLHCFAGCNTSSVLDRMGLGFPDLREPGEPVAATSSHGPSHLVDTYEYLTPQGSVYARKLRLGPIKRFCWERWTPNGWVKGLNGIKPDLFGVDELSGVRRVFVCEGEKGVRVLRRHGFAATCPPNGASQWTESWSAMLWELGARELIVLPDADRTGRKHAKRVVEISGGWHPATKGGVGSEGEGLVEASDLLQARLVELSGLNPHEDIVDWLGSGTGSAEELLRLADRAMSVPLESRAERCRRLNRERQRRHRERLRAGQGVRCVMAEDGEGGSKGE